MSVFKAYDIRGLAGSQLDTEFANRLGSALVTHLDANSIAVARDIRESGPELHEAFLQGITGAGADVIDLGITTTGVLYDPLWTCLSMQQWQLLRAITPLNITDSRFVEGLYQWPEKNCRN